jgi:GTPase SAR1 family protein
MLRICDKNWKFLNSFVSTIGIDYKLFNFFSNNKKIECQIWDMAGIND